MWLEGIPVRKELIYYHFSVYFSIHEKLFGIIKTLTAENTSENPIFCVSLYFTSKSAWFWSHYKWIKYSYFNDNR